MRMAHRRFRKRRSSLRDVILDDDIELVAWGIEHR